MRIDGYTGPGYIQTLFTIVMLLLTVITFKEMPYNERPGRYAQTHHLDVQKPKKVGIIVCNLICLIVFNSFAVQETITAPLVTDNELKYTESFGWKVWGAYALFAGSGLVSIGSFALVHFLTDRIEERLIMAVTLCINACAWVVMFDF